MRRRHPGFSWVENWMMKALVAKSSAVAPCEHISHLLTMAAASTFFPVRFHFL